MELTLFWLEFWKFERPPVAPPGKFFLWIDRTRIFFLILWSKRISWVRLPLVPLQTGWKLEKKSFIISSEKNEFCLSGFRKLRFTRPWSGTIGLPSKTSAMMKFFKTYLSHSERTWPVVSSNLSTFLLTCYWYIRVGKSRDFRASAFRTMDFFSNPRLYFVRVGKREHLSNWREIAFPHRERNSPLEPAAPECVDFHNPVPSISHKRKPPTSNRFPTQLDAWRSGNFT